MKSFFLFLAPLVIAVQETWFLPTDPYDFSLRNYCLYRYDEVNGIRRHGGTGLYISKDLTHTEIALNSPLQVVACTVRLNRRNIDICSVYIPPDYDTTELLRNLDALVAQFENPFVLLGDFNGHSPLWDRQRNDRDHRGRIIEDFLNSHNLVILNKGDSTHFSFSHNTQSAIDLSICSSSICTLFEWSTDSDVYDSDHFPIKIHTTFDT